MRPRIFVTSALMVVGVSGAHAQQAASSIDSMRQVFAHEADSASLRRRELSLARAAKTSTDAMLERGMLLLRLFELNGSDNDASEARDVLERAAKTSPTDARAHYAFGLSNSTPLGVRVPSPAGVLDGLVLGQSIAEIIKVDPASKAKRSYKRALELDPKLAGAAIELARLSLASRDNDNMQVAAVALRQLTKAELGGAEAATALSELEAALGNLAAAADAAMVATKVETGSSAALRAQAAALLRQDGKEDEGGRAYFAGIELLDAVGAKAYFDDVLPIVTERERSDWDNASIDAQKEFLRRFWDVRAASGGVTVAERIAEHYRRLAMAHDRYRRSGKRGSPPGGVIVQKKYADDMLPFDDRGLILVRHGEPSEIVRTASGELRPNETWVYLRRPKNQLFNFVMLRETSDYRMVDDVLQAVDPAQRGIPVDDIVKLLRDREAYEPRYAALATKFESFARNAQRASAFDMVGVAGGVEASAAAAENSMQGAGDARQRIAADQRMIAYAALETDTDQPDFTGDLPFYYDIYSFKGENGLTAVTAALAIPASSLSARAMGAHYIYALKASLIFIDTVTNAIARKDTVYTLRSSRVLGANEHLRLHLDLSAAYSASATHRIVLRDLVTPGKGQLYGGEADLKGFNASSLMISDVVLAEPGNGSWRRGSATLGLVPPRQFEEGRPLRLFYELYNLAPETPYRTEITMQPMEGGAGFGRLKRLLGGSGGKVQVKFEGVAPANTNGIIQELREIAPQAKPGKYSVVVRVTNLQNQQAAHSETLFVVTKK